MTRLCAILLLSLIATTTVAQNPYLAGLGYSYGQSTKTAGINARAYFFLNKKISLGPELTYFMPDIQNINGTEVSEGSTEYNLNLHYHFKVNSKWSFYPLFGGNFTRKFLIIDDPTSTFLLLKLNTGFGANIGGGIQYRHHNLSAFAEYKHLTGDFSQAMPTLGLQWTFRNKD